MRSLGLAGFMVMILSLLLCTAGVAKDDDEDQGILLEEYFEGQAGASWETLRADAGCGFLIDKNAFNVFDGGANWQFRIPFSNEPPTDMRIGGIICEFKYKVIRSKRDQGLIIGLGWEPHVAALSLNSTNLAYENAEGWDNEKRALPAAKSEWHSVRIMLGDNTYDVYLNGAPVGLNIPLLAKAQAVNYVAMWTNPDDQGNTGEWYIDDLIVSTVPFAVEPLERVATTWGNLKAIQ